MSKQTYKDILKTKVPTTITVKKDILKCRADHFYVTEWDQQCEHCVELKKTLTRMAKGS